jgi:HAD superfamily phosphoserine phosphatase-like hydrolase
VKYKKFSDEIWNKINTELDQELNASSVPLVAAFDADGTLWDTDLGEAFFKYQIKQNILPEFKKLSKEPWRHYRDWKDSGDPRPAYLWLAQINSGFPIADVRAWAEEAVVAHSPLPIFEDQKKLIDLFLSKKVEVYIVTASVAWGVEPGAKRLQLPYENVIGVKTKISNGLVTADQDGPITYREGKVAGLLEKTGGRKPFFACGNTTGDTALLSSAKLSLAVGAAKEGDELFKTEEALCGEAKKNGWMIHQF